MTRADADVRVARGMALLDEQVPGWEKRIDLDTLDITSTCVLHQVFGRYDIGVAALDQRSYETRCDHGFTASFMRGSGELLNTLTLAWRDAITARRAA